MLSLKQNGKWVELQEERDWKGKMVAGIILEARKVIGYGKGSPGEAASPALVCAMMT